MNIGIDLGYTIKGVRSDGHSNRIAPDSFRVIEDFIKRGDEVFIISKVTSEQKERAETWLKNVDFFNKTGVNPQNLYFCFDRRDKALFAKALGIQIMIDDRAEVMANLLPTVVKFLINPETDDYDRHSQRLFNCKVVTNWLEIERALF
jgi:hypothetical protein